MSVTRVSSKRGKRFRRNVKARSPWTRRAVVKAGSDRTFRSPIPRIRRPDYGYPDKLVTNLRYVDTVNLTGGAGVVGANVFRMNGLFDPDYSGVGHQPYYFDQLCGAAGSAPYLKYRVLGSKITTKFMIKDAPSTAAANVGPVVVGLLMSATNGLYGSTASALCEASGCQWTYLGDKGAANNVVTLYGTYQPSRDLGNDEGDDTVAASYNANPSQMFNGIPWKVDTVGAAVVTALVEIDFRVEFYDRNEVAQS